MFFEPIKNVWGNLKDIPARIQRLIDLSAADGAVFLDNNGNYQVVPFGVVEDTIAEGNDPRLSDSREWSALTVDAVEAQAGTGTTRRAWTSLRVREAITGYTEKFTLIEKNKLMGLDSTNYLPVEGTAVNSSLLDNLGSSQFLRSDIPDTANSRIACVGSQVGSIASNTAGHLGGIEVRASDFTTNNAAFMAFHRPGFAAYFGLDTDNQLKIGGWSMGVNAYPLWHKGYQGIGTGMDSDLWQGWSRELYLNQAVRTDSTPTFPTVTLTGANPLLNLAESDFGGNLFKIQVNDGILKLGRHNVPETLTLNHLGIVDIGDPIAKDYQDIKLRVGGSIYTNSGAIITNCSINSPVDPNVDHIWHDDSTNTWHLCSNTTYRGKGNAAIQVGTLKLGGVDGVSFLHDTNHSILQTHVGSSYFKNLSHGGNFYFQSEDSGGTNRALCYMHPESGVNLYYNGALRFNTTSTGAYVAGTLVNSSSGKNKVVKRRLKNCIEEIGKLNPIFYYLKADRTKRVHPGFIAEEVPLSLGITYKEENEIGLNYAQLSAWLVGAVQEINKRLEKIEKTLNSDRD